MTALHTPAGDSPCVLVRADLRPSTYRAFAARAEAEGTTIGVLLSRLADVALTPAPAAPVRRRYTRWTPALLDQLRALNAEGLSDGAIARRLKLPQPSVSAHRRGLGLLSPHSR